MAYAIVRYRHRKGVERRAEYEPEYKKLEWWLIGLTSVGVIAMLAPGLAVWAKFVTVPDDAKVVEAWASSGRGASGCRARTACSAPIDASLIERGQSVRHGCERSARAGRRAGPGQELHLPIDQPVKVLLRSKDVLHDFTVPQFRVKMDIVPGMITYLWLTPTKAGDVRDPVRGALRDGALRHARPRRRRRRRRLRSLARRRSRHSRRLHGAARRPMPPRAQGAYRGLRRLSRRRTAKATRRSTRPSSPGLPALVPRRGSCRTSSRACAAAAPGDAHRQPDGGDRRSRSTTRRSTTSSPISRHCPTGDAVHGHAATPGAARRATRPAPTATVPAARARGRPTRHRLAGMSDWYLARQLQQFRRAIAAGIRRISTAAQMARMSGVVPDGEATHDLLAYINTLR